MSYTRDHANDNMNAPRVLQTSATSWRQLVPGAERARGTVVKIGANAIILPAFSRVRLGNGRTLGALPAGAGNPLDDLFDSYVPTSLVPQDNLNTLYPLNATGQVILPSNYPSYFDAPPVSQNKTIPLAQALLNAGLTTAQIATTAAGGTPATAQAVRAPVAATVGQIVPGLSNSTILIVGVIGLMFLASGKRR